MADEVDKDKQIAALNELLLDQAQMMRQISDAIHDANANLIQSIGTALYDLSGFKTELDRITETIHLPSDPVDDVYAAGDCVVILSSWTRIPIGIGYVAERSNTTPGTWIIDVVGYGRRPVDALYLRLWKDRD